MFCRLCVMLWFACHDGLIECVISLHVFEFFFQTPFPTTLACAVQ